MQTIQVELSPAAKICPSFASDASQGCRHAVFAGDTLHLAPGAHEFAVRGTLFAQRASGPSRADDINGKGSLCWRTRDSQSRRAAASWPSGHENAARAHRCPQQLLVALI